MTLADELEQLGKNQHAPISFDWLYPALRHARKCSGPWDDFDGELSDDAAGLVVALVNNLPAIIAALRALERQQDKEGTNESH